MSNQRGEVKLTTLLLLAAVVVGGYILVRVAPVYILDFKIKNVARSAAKFTVDPVSKRTVEVYLKRQCFENDLPVQPEDFVIEDRETSATVTVSWSRDVAFIPENGIVPPVIRRFSFTHAETEQSKR